MFFSKSLSLGRISGIAIGVDYSWFIIFGLFVFLLGSAYLPVVVPGMPVGWYWGIAVLTSVLFFASVLGHELSHALVARRDGTPVTSITLFIFGGVAQMEDEPPTPMSEFKMAIAGPLASVGIALFFLGVTAVAAVMHSRLLYAAFFYLFFINMVLAVFNMIPGFPMDGGRVFRAILWGATKNLQKSTLVASVVGQTFGWSLIVLGVGSLILPPLRAYGSIWLALVGWFLISAARNSYQQLVIREALRGVPVTAMMNAQVDAVAPDITVDHLVTEYFLQEGTSVLPVEQRGELIGTVSIDDVRAVPREQWGTLLVREIMRPLQDEQTVHLDNDAWDAANRLSRAESDRVLVTENGHIAGVITRGAIVRWLQTHLGGHTRPALGEA